MNRNNLILGVTLMKNLTDTERAIVLHVLIRGGSNYWWDIRHGDNVADALGLLFLDKHPDLVARSLKSLRAKGYLVRGMHYNGNPVLRLTERLDAEAIEAVKLQEVRYQTGIALWKSVTHYSQRTDAEVARLLLDRVERFERIVKGTSDEVSEAVKVYGHGDYERLLVNTRTRKQRVRLVLRCHDDW